MNQRPTCKSSDYKPLLRKHRYTGRLGGSVGWASDFGSGQVMISRSVNSSPASGSVLTAQSLEPASDSVSPSLSAPPLLMLCLSLSQKYINLKKKLKNSPNSTPEKQITQWRNGQKTWIDTSLKKTSGWPTCTWKDVQRRSSSGKCKSKPHSDITSRQSEWPKWTNQETIDAGEDVEKWEPSFTVGGNANLCNHFGK